MAKIKRLTKISVGKDIEELDISWECNMVHYFLEKVWQFLTVKHLPAI